MDIKQAKQQLASFLDGRTLTFSITHFPDGEWTAECNEISGIITGGKGEDITERDALLRDAILTAAGLDTEFSKDLLRFEGYQSKVGILGSFFGVKQTAEYIPVA